MRATTERYIPDEAKSPEELVIGLLHLYAYHAAAEMVSAGDRVLDVGFGEGYGASILASAGAEYLGLEVDPAAVEHARSRYGLAFETYDGSTIASPDDAFDLVTSFQVVEHLDDPGPWLAEIGACSVPAGKRCSPHRTALTASTTGSGRGTATTSASSPRVELRELLLGPFSEVQVYGVRGSEEIDAIERARVARARRLARLDPLGLRYRLPEGFDTRLRRALRRGAQAEVDRGELTLEQMRHDEPPESGLDLLAVATGPR